jgi:hypothetical protein
MRIALAVLAALAACTSPDPPALEAPALEADLARPLPPEPPASPISGYVVARDQGKLSLDSGGQHLVPLKVDARTPTLRDGQKGTAADVREGDVVRAAYTMDADGAARALQLVVNSRPVTGRATPPGTNAEPEPRQSSEPLPEGQPTTGERPVVMEVSPVETRR